MIIKNPFRLLGQSHPQEAKKQENSLYRVLIIGNGFDLDCGFLTTYSKFCDFFFDRDFEVCQESGLYFFLRQKYHEYLVARKRKEKCWFDLEMEIQEYALRNKDSFSQEKLDADRRFMAYLRDRLALCFNLFGYLTPYNETSSFVSKNTDDPNLSPNPSQFRLRKNTISYKICLGFVRYPQKFDKIVTFNYTSLPLFIERIVSEECGNDKELIKNKIRDLNLEEKLIKIHLSNNTLLTENDDLSKYGILRDKLTGVCGISDSVDIPESLSFLKKSTQIKERNKTEVLDALKKADEIIIFGHSLGMCDEDYFKTVFQDIFLNHAGKKIQIITFDDNRSILENIAKMLGWDVDKLLFSSQMEKIHFIYSRYVNSQLEYEDMIRSL